MIHDRTAELEPKNSREKKKNIAHTHIQKKKKLKIENGRHKEKGKEDQRLFIFGCFFRIEQLVIYLFFFFLPNPRFASGLL
jgi:hypothetical protein